MSPISVTREFTNEDSARLARAAKRFASNHPEIHVDFDIVGDNASDMCAAIDYAVDEYVYWDGGKLRSQWKRVIKTALHNDGDTWGWGHVGWSVD